MFRSFVFPKEYACPERRKEDHSSTESAFTNFNVSNARAVWKLI